MINVIIVIALSIYGSYFAIKEYKTECVLAPATYIQVRKTKIRRKM